MKTVIKTTKSFKRQAKPLLKKYASLPGELRQLEKDLSTNPYLGTEVIKGIYKIRLAIKSKGKGKSGGARVIAFHEEETVIIGILEQTEDTEHIINLISIYDKSEVENISDSEIKRLIENMEIED
ncbi:MAG: addiction module toxin RelE [Bacteroidales bacterium]|jgi:mRNA-degrading endonuclease RelE of RelBE toxin-antitoxin system|nr:addiction module toxin RelE [Bacteroidales bacterium]